MLRELEKATRGTVSNIEMMSKTIQARNFKISMETALHGLDIVDDGQFVALFLKVQFLESKKFSIIFRFTTSK